MVTHKVREKLYRLDEIYTFHRKDKNNYAAKIIFACIHDFTEYWRQLEDRDFDGLRKHERDELYFFFNEKLYEIARSHLDLYWLTYDYDDQPLYRNGDVPASFWQEGRRNPKKRRIRVRAQLNT